MLAAIVLPNASGGKQSCSSVCVGPHSSRVLFSFYVLLLEPVLH